MSAVVAKVALYVITPMAVFALPYFAGFIGYGHLMYGESGFIEWMTVLFLLVAIMMLATHIRRAGRLGGHLLAYLLLLLLGAIYFCGEEVSWGQWIFYWSTPDAWEALNDQQETNLHNLRGAGVLLDQLPRLGLSLAAFIGGICVPFYRFTRGIQPPPVNQWQGWWPTMACLPVAALSLLVRPIDNWANDVAPTGWVLAGSGELKECLLALFIMIYVVVLCRRVREARA